jgi:hypothetical protein
MKLSLPAPESQGLAIGLCEKGSGLGTTGYAGLVLAGDELRSIGLAKGRIDSAFPKAGSPWSRYFLRPLNGFAFIVGSSNRFLQKAVSSRFSTVKRKRYPRSFWF